MSHQQWSLAAAVASFAFSAAPVFAQSVISAEAGLVHYAEGRVFLNGELIGTGGERFLQMRANQALLTEAGRAEVLLTPGVFLRVAEDSAFRMIDSRLVAVELEFLAGAILLEAAEVKNPVTVRYGGASVSLLKSGLYRLDSKPPLLRVYQGKAVVAVAGKRVSVGKNRLFLFQGPLRAGKFDQRSLDGFEQWSSRRTEYLAMVNIAAAASVYESGLAWDTSQWYWDPFFGMYTFVPSRRTLYGGHGHPFWSPRTVHHRNDPPSEPTDTFSIEDAGEPSSSTSARAPASSESTGTRAPATTPSSPSAPIEREAGRAGGRTR